jgi:uncharacterized protein YdaU (DUF1376 family)
MRGWMPFYIGDYLADTQHLTTLQHGAYLLLIMHYWHHEALPTDEKAIARICRLNRVQWESNCQAIAKLFLTGWKHKRIEVEIGKSKKISAERALSGYKGGKASRGKTNGERFISQAIAKQTGTQSPSHLISSLEASRPSDAESPQVVGEKERKSFGSPELAAINRRKGWA